VRKTAYGKVIEETLQEFETALPQMDAFLLAGRHGAEQFCNDPGRLVRQPGGGRLSVPDRLSSDLSDALGKWWPARFQAFADFEGVAILVLSNSGEEAGEDVLSAADELFLQRDKLTGKGGPCWRLRCTISAFARISRVARQRASEAV
jgi:hypothetical protein